MSLCNGCATYTKELPTPASLRCVCRTSNENAMKEQEKKINHANTVYNSQPRVLSQNLGVNEETYWESTMLNERACM